jgi:hypothetical protein
LQTNPYLRWQGYTPCYLHSLEYADWHHARRTAPLEVAMSGTQDYPFLPEAKLIKDAHLA